MGLAETNVISDSEILTVKSGEYTTLPAPAGYSLLIEFMSFFGGSAKRLNPIRVIDVGDLSTFEAWAMEEDEFKQQQMPQSVLSSVDVELPQIGEWLLPCTIAFDRQFSNLVIEGCSSEETQILVKYKAIAHNWGEWDAGAS